MATKSVISLKRNDRIPAGWTYMTVSNWFRLGDCVEVDTAPPPDTPRPGETEVAVAVGAYKCQMLNRYTYRLFFYADDEVETV